MFGNFQSFKQILNDLNIYTIDLSLRFEDIGPKSHYLIWLRTSHMTLIPKIIFNAQIKNRLPIEEFLNFGEIHLILHIHNLCQKMVSQSSVYCFKLY